MGAVVRVGLAVLLVAGVAAASSAAQPQELLRCLTPSEAFVGQFKKVVKARYWGRLGAFRAVRSHGKFAPFPRSLQKGVYFVSVKVVGLGFATWAVSADSYRGGSGVIFGAEPVSRRISTLGVDESFPAVLKGWGISPATHGFDQSRTCAKFFRGFPRTRTPF
jgi:hypothetical protein